MRMIHQNVQQNVLFILFHWAIFIWGHLDTRISVARVLYNVSFWFLTECVHLSFFATFIVCILWAWALDVTWTMPCLLYRGAYHVFLWSMWWLAQACKLGFVMLLISVPVLLLFWCHVNLMLQRDPCIFWDTSVRVFWTIGYFLSIHSLGCNYGVA